jgi:hypothetical protein
MGEPMFEPVITEDLKKYLSKWIGKPRDKYDREKVQHYAAILGKDAKFFYDTNKLSSDALTKMPDNLQEKFHFLWTALREFGWRYCAYHENDISHWYCTFDVFKASNTHDLREPTEAEQTRWESDYYADKEFVPEVAICKE